MVNISCSNGHLLFSRPGDEAVPLLVEGLANEVVIGVACGDGQTLVMTTSGVSSYVLSIMTAHGSRFSGIFSVWPLTAKLVQW